MKIVPDSPPPISSAAKTGLKVEALAPAKAAKPVQPHAGPPLAAQRAHSHASPDIAVQAERRHDVDIHGERRTYCRRIEHLPVLIELRAGRDRRRHNQRGDDLTEHVDEKV